MSARAGFITGSAALALATARPARAQSPFPTLRIGCAPSDAFAQAWYAQDMGFFARAGLTVDLQPFNSGSAAATAIAGGSLDIGVTTPIPIANAVIRGVPFVVIAAASVNTAKAPQFLLITRKSGPIRNAKDLVGKTVGVNTLKTLLELTLDVYLAKNNVEIPSVRAIEVVFSEMGIAIDRGTIDAAMIGEPQLSAALRSNDVRILTDPTQLIAPRFVGGVWFTSQQFAQRNPEAIKRYVAVMYETARWANRHRLESGRILVKYTKMNVEDVSAMIRADFAEETRLNEIQPVLDVCAKFNYIPRPILAAEMMPR